MDDRKQQPPSLDPALSTKKLTAAEITEIAKEFSKRLEDLKTLPMQIEKDTSNFPLFKEEDIKTSSNALDVMIRMLFVRYGISRPRFMRQFRECAISILGIPMDQITAQRENYLRKVRNGGITWKMFENLALVILGLRLNSITAKFSSIFDDSFVTIIAELGKEIVQMNENNKNLNADSEDSE